MDQQLLLTFIIANVSLTDAACVGHLQDVAFQARLYFPVLK